MIYLNKYSNFFKHDNNFQKFENPIRSERLLNDIQRNWNKEDKIESYILPTILFSDIEGSSKMWLDDPKKMMDLLELHYDLVYNLSKKNGGWIVKSIGDAFMVYFKPSVDSLEKALIFSEELIREENNFKIRIGVSKGPVFEKEFIIQNSSLKDFYGNTVNVASRMESRVSENSGNIAFTSSVPITEIELESINKNIKNGYIEKVDISKYDFKGAKANFAYRLVVIK